LSISPHFAAAQPAAGPAQAFRDKVTVETDVEYGQAGDVSLKLDVLRPKDGAAEKRPCIVWIHGGGWQGGNKNSGMGRLAPYVASGEYVGVSVGYRLTNVAGWPAQAHDCKAAIRWVRANADKYGVDPDKIGAWGSSAGGHLVALLGTSGDAKEIEGEVGSPGHSSRVSCVVDYFGPTDFLAFATDTPRTATPNSPEVKLLGGPATELKDKAREASPTTYVTKDDPPFLILHGTKDPLVPLSQSELLHKKLQDAGVSSTLVIVEGAGHGFGGGEVEGRVSAFFAKHLLGKDVAVSAAPIQAK
jgi:acetyl esterase/lipase